MDATTLKGLLDGAQQVAITVAALATLAGWFVGRRVESEKEKKEEARLSQERHDREQLLDKAGKAETAYTSLLADTKEIRERLAKLYPGVSTEEALRRLEEELGHVKELAQRRDYRPLNANARTALVERLRSIRLLATEGGLKVRVYVEAGGPDENRDRLVKDIAKVLADAGVDAFVGAPSFHVGGPAFPPLSVCVRPEHASAAQALVEALDSYLSGRLRMTRDEKCPASEILLRVSGTPAFGQGGTVTVE